MTDAGMAQGTPGEGREAAARRLHSCEASQPTIPCTQHADTSKAWRIQLWEEILQTACKKLHVIILDSK